MYKHGDIIQHGEPVPETRLVKSFETETADDVIAFLQNQHECEKYNRIVISNAMKATIEYIGFPNIFSLYWVADKIRFYEPANVVLPVTPKKPNVLSELHNRIILENIKREVADAASSYNRRPKLNVTQMGFDDGFVTVTVSVPENPNNQLMVMNMYKVIQEALAKREEEILNA